jgi:hypothetical protein
MKLETQAAGWERVDLVLGGQKDVTLAMASNTEVRVPGSKSVQGDGRP